MRGKEKITLTEEVTQKLDTVEEGTGVEAYRPKEQVVVEDVYTQLLHKEVQEVKVSKLGNLLMYLVCLVCVSVGFVGYVYLLFR